MDLAAIANEESIFKLNFDEIRAKIDADPYFEVESIDYLFPDTLRIQVFERRASAAIRYQDSFLVVDEDGLCPGGAAGPGATSTCPWSAA